MIGCNESTDVTKELTFRTNNLIISVVLKDIKYIYPDNEEPHSLLYGLINFQNTSNDTVIVNLNDYKIQIQEKKADIYLDSPASIIVGDEVILPNNNLEKNVYWGFNKKISNADLQYLKMINL